MVLLSEMQSVALHGSDDRQSVSELFRRVESVVTGMADTVSIETAVRTAKAVFGLKKSKAAAYERYLRNVGKTAFEYPDNLSFNSLCKLYGIEISQTNYDRIRNMSVEEMAAFFNEGFLCPPGYATADGLLLTDKCVYHNDSDDEPCRRCWLDWLKQEAEHGT